MPPTLEGIEASLATTETWIRWLALFAAVFTFSAAGAGVRLWLLQGQARPLRENARRAAEERIASLHARIADANKASSEAAARAAEANRAAAEANEKAEKERLARVKIEERMAPRRLTREQQKRISESLKRYAGQKLNVFAYNSSPEAMSIANEVIAALTGSGAGWVLSVSAGQEGSGRAVPGMLLEVKATATQTDSAAARALVEALSREGLAVAGPARPWEGASALMGSINEDPTANIKLTIGHKP